MSNVPSDDFFEQYCKWDRAMIEDPATAALVYNSFCLFMQHWMLNKQETVDLGFVRLSAVMARKTWDMALWRKVVFEKRERLKKERKHPPKKWIPLSDFICQMLTHENMTAWDRKKEIFRWTLVATPSPDFIAVCEQMEQAKKAERGPVEYVRGATEQMKRQISKMYEAFVYFVKEASHPIAMLPDSPKSRWANGFRPHWRRKKNVIKGDVCDCKPARKYGGYPAVLGGDAVTGSAYAMVLPDESVPPMSDLQSQNENVRDSGNNVVQPAQSQDGAIRVHVLHADESEAESELLAVRPNSGGDGMATQPQLESDQEKQ